MSTRIENTPSFVIAQKYLGVSVRKHVLHPALYTDSLFRVSHWMSAVLTWGVTLGKS